MELKRPIRDAEREKILLQQASRRRTAPQSGFLQAVSFIAQLLDVFHLFEHDPHNVRKIHAGTPVAGLLGLLCQFATTERSLALAQQLGKDLPERWLL